MVSAHPTSISQRHISAAKLVYEKQYYGLVELGTVLGMFLSQDVLPREKGLVAQPCHVARNKKCLLLKCARTALGSRSPSFLAGPRPVQADLADVAHPLAPLTQVLSPDVLRPSPEDIIFNTLQNGFR